MTLDGGLFGVLGQIDSKKRGLAAGPGILGKNRGEGFFQLNSKGRNSLYYKELKNLFR
jgi:hypothetical protein